MSNERDDLERKKREAKKKERNNNLMKIGSVALSIIGVLIGVKGKKS